MIVKCPDYLSLVGDDFNAVKIMAYSLSNLLRLRRLTSIFSLRGSCLERAGEPQVGQSN